MLWPILAAAAGVAAVLLLEKSGATSAPRGAAPGAAPPGARLDGAMPIPIALSGPLELFPGHTYFGVVELNGLASAGGPADVKREAEKLGFRDVAIFTEKDRPQFWPGTRRGPYYVRGTYRGAQKRQPVKTSGFLWSVVVLDAWIAPLDGGEL